VDGGFKSGVDVIMAAAMGADEFGFGSLAMIATGCVMARICHTNNCPVGVASQVRGNFFLSDSYLRMLRLSHVLVSDCDSKLINWWFCSGRKCVLGSLECRAI